MGIERMIPSVNHTNDEDDKEKDDHKKKKTDKEQYPRSLTTLLIRAWKAWYPRVRHPITE